MKTITQLLAMITAIATDLTTNPQNYSVDSAELVRAGADRACDFIKLQLEEDTEISVLEKHHILNKMNKAYFPLVDINTLQ